MCSHAVSPRPDPLRFPSFLPPTRPDLHNPQFMSFKTRPGPGPAVRASAHGSSTTSTAINGVVSDPNAVSFYELLGIPETGTVVEIKQAYKQLARKYHPDVSPPGRAEEYTRAFIRVQEAYETLSDPSSRAMYDRDMARGVHLAFTARKRSKFDEEMADREEWKSRWQSQLSNLKKQHVRKDSDENLSWAARIRKERNESL